MKLGDYLKTKKMGVRQFATEMGFSPTSVYDWVAGKRKPSADIMYKLHEATNGKVTLKDFAAASFQPKEIKK